MNHLTTLRDLIYQERFTESLRLAHNTSYRSLGLCYIKAHSKKHRPSCKSFWPDDGWGFRYLIGDSINQCTGDGISYNYGIGTGYYYSIGDGFSYKYNEVGHGSYYGDHTVFCCPWGKRCRY